MGLDSILLIERIEAHFGIAIPNHEAQTIITVQDIADCVFAKVELNPNEKCKSQILFYKLRNYFILKFGLSRDEIKPSSIIKDLIQSDLKYTWDDLGSYLQLELPPLTALDLNPALPAEFKLLGIPLFNRKPPITSKRLGDLTAWILAINYQTLIKPHTLFTKADVEKAVIGIISEEMGIQINRIQLQNSIYHDLGIC